MDRTAQHPTSPGPAQSGFTLTELLMVTLCAAISACTALPSAQSYLEHSRVQQAAQDIRHLEAALSRYASTHHALPDSLGQLDTPVPLDPWGHPYEYVNFHTHGSAAQLVYHQLPLNTEYDLYSRGSNGRTDVAVNADIAASTDDIVRARDGEFVGLAANF